MARSYSFAIVRLTPSGARDESLNVGVVVFNEGSLDVRVAKRMDKLRAISAAVDHAAVRDLLNNLATLDEKLRDRGSETVDARLSGLSSVGPISLSKKGTFVADNSAAYEGRLASIMKAMIDVEPLPFRAPAKRSHLFTQIKTSFRQERVLAKRGEDISSHRIVPSFELDRGLVADLVLQNGAIHVVETVDASGDEDTLRRAIGEIGIAALVLERARMKFGNQTKAKLVYTASAALEKIAKPSFDAAEHQGAQLINWESADQRNKFIHLLASLATPFERSTKGKIVRVATGRMGKLDL